MPTELTQLLPNYYNARRRNKLFFYKLINKILPSTVFQWNSNVSDLYFRDAQQKSQP
jgi:hypothetical protein